MYALGSQAVMVNGKGWKGRQGNRSKQYALTIESGEYAEQAEDRDNMSLRL